jgi:hypothetical protein
MSDEERGDIGEFIVTMRAEADQMKPYVEALQKLTYELSDIGERGATSATLCGIEQALAQISQSTKQIGKDRHNAALVLGMDELIATQHKTLDQFAEGTEDEDDISHDRAFETEVREKTEATLIEMRSKGEI